MSINRVEDVFVRKLLLDKDDQIADLQNRLNGLIRTSAPETVKITTLDERHPGSTKSFTSQKLVTIEANHHVLVEGYFDIRVGTELDLRDGAVLAVI